MAETGGVPLNASPVRRWAGVFGHRPFAFSISMGVKTSDGMNWNLQDLVYEALSEEWRKKGRRDQRPLGGRRAKRIPATLIRAGQPRTQDSPNTLRWPDLTSKKRRRAPFLNLLKSFYILLGPPQPLETLGSEDVTGDKKGANRGQKGSEPGTKRERTGDKRGTKVHGSYPHSRVPLFFLLRL